MKGCRSGRAPARVLMGLVLLGLPACQVVQGVKEATVSAAKEVSGKFFGGPDPATPRAPVRSPTATAAGDSHAPSPTTQPLVKKAGCPDFTPFSALQPRLRRA